MQEARDSNPVSHRLRHQWGRARGLFAHRVAVSLLAGTGILALALIVVIALIVRPDQDARAAGATWTLGCSPRQLPVEFTGRGSHPVRSPCKRRPTPSERQKSSLTTSCQPIATPIQPRAEMTVVTAAASSRCAPWGACRQKVSGLAHSCHLSGISHCDQAGISLSRERRCVAEVRAHPGDLRLAPRQPQF